MQMDSPFEYTTTPIYRGTGTNSAERYLKKLCNRTFLSLWSYSSVFRDQGGPKEVCDLLVVFYNHVIIFSDKDCVFPETGDINLDWNRWYKKAIKHSVKQVWGAERWLKEHPENLYIDPKCKQHFPIDLPGADVAKYHRIVVAHSVLSRCKKECGGSGSLILQPNIIGDQHLAEGSNNGLPFHVGQVDPDKGFVHVMDDNTLTIILQKLDTVLDFISYLEKKERFLSDETSFVMSREEDLLALYLSNLNEADEHCFSDNNKNSFICNVEGGWAQYINSIERHSQIQADKISYNWDRLIEHFSETILQGTHYIPNFQSVNESERALRIMAAEDRLNRRILSTWLVDFFDNDVDEGQRVVRTLKPDQKGCRYYVLILFAHESNESYEEYRKTRLKCLDAYCLVTRLRFPDALDIVGMAFEPRNSRGSSEDLMYFNARTWDNELEKTAKILQTELDLPLSNELKVRHYHDNEYPKTINANAVKMKGADRNKPCPCGSGRKFKRCCGT